MTCSTHQQDVQVTNPNKMQQKLEQTSRYTSFRGLSSVIHTYGDLAPISADSPQKLASTAPVPAPWRNEARASWTSPERTRSRSKKCRHVVVATSAPKCPCHPQCALPELMYSGNIDACTESTSSTSLIHSIASVRNCEQVHTSFLNRIFQQANVAGVGRPIFAARREKAQVDWD